MPQLINQDTVTENDWEIVGRESPLPKFDDASNYFVHITNWLENLASLRNNANVGVWLESDDTPEQLEPYLNDLSIIAINFPAFADGRGYSIARRLRDQLNYKGELRAVGDVLKDQIFFYQRCGFDSYLIREDRPAEEALKSQQDFSAVYQSAADQRQPVLRKR